MQLHMPNERLYGGGSQRRRIMDADEPFLPPQLQPKMPINPAPMPAGPLPFEGSGPGTLAPAMMPTLTPGLRGNEPTRKIRGFGQMGIMNSIGM